VVRGFTIFNTIGEPGQGGECLKRGGEVHQEGNLQGDLRMGPEGWTKR